MRVEKITIKNILGLESLEIEPNSITEISGANGTGKTSCLEAIRAALGSGHDAELLRKGAHKGEVVLLLEDGTEIQKSITPDSSKTTVKHPQYGKISKPATYIKRLADALSMNPIAFLTASKKERVDQLLQAIPMQVTTEQLGFVPMSAMAGVDLEDHALEVIAAIGKAIYDFRTGVNRAEKEKRATVNQMTETLPEDAPEGDWKKTYADLDAQLQTINKVTQAAIETVDGGAKILKEKADSKREEQKKAARAEYDRILEEAVKVRDTALELADKEHSEAIEHVEFERVRMRESEIEANRPKHDELKEQIGRARAMIEQHAKAETTRGHIKQLTEDADKLEAESTKLTHALGKLEQLKNSLLESLPIKGVSLQDGDIYVEGIQFDHVNESRRIRLAIDIAQLRAGEIGLVAVDGLERLDPKTYAIFKEEAAKTPLQFVVCKVTDGPLEISTGGKEAA